MFSFTFGRVFIENRSEMQLYICTHIKLQFCGLSLSFEGLSYFLKHYRCIFYYQGSSIMDYTCIVQDNMHPSNRLNSYRHLYYINKYQQKQYNNTFLKSRIADVVNKCCIFCKGRPRVAQLSCKSPESHFLSNPQYKIIRSFRDELNCLFTNTMFQKSACWI